MEGILRFLAPVAVVLGAAMLSAQTADSAPGVEPVAHGMVVTTKDGEKVRVLAFRDGAYRVTVAADPARAANSLMVVAEADGSPKFSRTADSATLTTPTARAEVRLADGRLRVFNAAGSLLLDEYRSEEHTSELQSH